MTHRARSKSHLNLNNILTTKLSNIAKICSQILSEFRSWKSSHFQRWHTRPCPAPTAEGSGPAFFFLMTIERLFFGVWDSRRTPFPDSILGVCHAFLLGAHTPSLIPQRTEVLHQLSDEAFTCLPVTRDLRPTSRPSGLASTLLE